MVLEAKFLVLHYISGIVQEGDIVTTEANAFYQMVLLSMTFSDP